MRQQPLQPDFVIELPQLGRRLLVEVKLTAREEGSPERDGLRDMLAYLADAHALFDSRPPPHGLVVAWNATGQPAGMDSWIVVSDQDHVGQCVAAVLASTASALDSEVFPPTRR